MRQVRRSIWTYLAYVPVAAVFLATGMRAFQWYLPQIRRHENLQRRLLVLETQIRREQARAHSLSNLIAALNPEHPDSNVVERLAREKLHYARPGETVIIFLPQSAATNQGALFQ